MEISSGIEICRLCLEDLSNASEYYSIEEELGNLILELVGILVDGNCTNLCVNCFSALEKFSHSKTFWLENQNKLDEKLAEYSDFKAEEEILQEEEISDPVDQIEENPEQIDEVSDQIEDVPDEVEDPVEEVITVEIVDPVQSKEESSKEEIEDEPEIYEEPGDQKASSSSRERGKAIYKKLLKPCPECGKVLEKNRLEGHINKHKNYRPYVCEHPGCGKAFYCKLLYRLHKTSIHTGISISCQVCSKTFPSERSLYTHSLRHRNENRYACDYCERRFNNNNSLNRHLAIHSGVREWKCDLCSSSFYRKFNLDVHVKAVHNKEKSFTCSYCPKRFGYSRLLKDHVKKSHGNMDQSLNGETIDVTVES